MDTDAIGNLRNTIMHSSDFTGRTEATLHNINQFKTFLSRVDKFKSAFDQFATTSGANLVVPDFFATSNFEGEAEVSFTKYKQVTQSARLE